MSDAKEHAGVGVDIGTANLLTARQKGDKAEVKMQRNAFIEVPADEWSKKMMTQLKVQYAAHEGRTYVLGDAAFDLANVLKKNTRRPMRSGMLHPDEADALPIMKLLLKQLLGAPRVKDEPAAYSVPANPIDSPMNVSYHQRVFDGLLTNLGYSPKPVVEGHAVVLAELADTDFTGIGISAGGGMFNVCVAFKSMPAVSFSTARGGDWIDQNAAMVCGSEATRMTRIKERGVDLAAPKSREEEAIAIYARELIEQTLTTITAKLKSEKAIPDFGEPVKIVLAGGTSLAGGFDEVFRQAYKKVGLPIEVKEIVRAKDPLTSVARGCLMYAMAR